MLKLKKMELKKKENQYYWEIDTMYQCRSVLYDSDNDAIEAAILNEIKWQGRNKSVDDLIKKNIYTIPRIIREVEKVSGISYEDIRSPKRKGEIVLARQVLTYIIYHTIDKNLRRIGEVTNRDHGTVKHSIKVVDLMRETKDLLIDGYEKLINKYINNLQHKKLSLLL